MKYKIGDMFEIMDKFGYYIIQYVYSENGPYQIVHISKDIRIDNPIRLASKDETDRQFANLQIKYVRNIFDE